MTYKVLAEQLNVRKTPGGIIIRTLKQGDCVRVAEIVGEWMRIDTGWISSKYCERVPSNHVLSTLALKYARLELGKGEIPRGSNWGKDVQGYLNSVGINKPAPWCMSFVYWVVQKASAELGQPNPLMKTGHVLTQWNASKSLRVVGNPERGDIFIIDFGGGKGHTGFVADVKADRIMTIEGNSNGQGSREGIEVCGKPNGRPFKTILGYLRLP